MKTNPKILVIQTAFLGDIILSLPMVQSLKELLPDSEIDYLCIPSTANVLQNGPYLRKIIIYNKKAGNKIVKLYKIISRIKNEKYDIVICPHRSFRSALITYFSLAKIRIGFNINSLSFLLTQKAKYQKNEHEIKRNLELIKTIPGLKYDESKISIKPELFPSAEDEIIVDEKINSFLNIKIDKLICFAPCSKWFTKIFPMNKSIELINTLTSAGYTVAIIGGMDDEKFCTEVEMRTEKADNVINMAGQFTPIQSACIIKKSKCLITVDSAAAHLGASTNTPIIMIFGSTVPAFGFYPLTSKNKIIENNNINCRPCTNHGRGSCPLKHFKCMNDISIEEIVGTVQELIN